MPSCPAVNSARPEFYCQLTFQIMEEPVMSPTGESYELEAIKSWLKLYGTTIPFSDEPLALNDFVPNRALHARICAWRQGHHLDGTENHIEASSRDDNAKKVHWASSVPPLKHEKSVAIESHTCEKKQLFPAKGRNRRELLVKKLSSIRG